MDLAANLAIAAGIVVEILLLWETSDRQKGAQTASGAFAPGLSRLQEIIALVLLVFWLLIGLAEYFKPPLSPAMLNLIQNAIMGPSFFFLFVYGMVIPKLLPRVNEQTIVLVNLVALYSLWSAAQLDALWLVALLIPSLGVLLMALSARPLHPYLKSLLYLWYLACLLLMAYQNNYAMFFKPASELEMTPFDYFVGGAAGIFLLLHSLFLVRFFLMLTALILPHNRRLITLTMPQLFDDQQIPRPRFLVFLALFVAIIAANQLTGFAPSASLLNVLILLAVHFMERPFHLTQRL